MQKILFPLIFLLILSSCRNSPSYGVKPGLLKDKAMLVTAHPEATRAGLQILESGGNAVDAMVAVHFALATVYPSAGNLGGGGFMMLRSPEGKVESLDFREMAPAQSHRDMYLDSAGNVIKNMSVFGHKASGIPGSVDGMWTAHQKYGNKPWGELLLPAVTLAQTGFPLTQKQADLFNHVREYLLVENDDTSLVRFLKPTPWKSGDTLKQPELGQTLQRIMDHGRDEFYLGTTAEMIVAEFAETDSFITLEDLASYHAKWREPVSGNYKNYTLYSMPPPSSGGIALMQLLGMAEAHPLQKMGWNSSQYVHTLAEIERRVYSDRAAHLGDADFWEVPQAEMLSKPYLTARMADFDPSVATPSEDIKAGSLSPTPESEETTHYSIIDAEGRAVAVTTTLNGSFGSMVVVNQAGFLLNNEMDDFSAKPGTPNIYGLVGGEANAVERGKRMLSSMTPTIVEKEGKLSMVLGTPGGSTIITSVFQVFLNVSEFGMTMQEAVEAKKFHHQWLPDKIQYEPGAFPPQTESQLSALGHTVMPRDPIGRVDAILIQKDGKLEGGADPRGDDVAAGL